MDGSDRRVESDRVVGQDYQEPNIRGSGDNEGATNTSPEVILTKNELKKTDVVLSRPVDSRGIFGQTLLEWSDLYGEAACKDKKEIARSLIADCVKRGVRFVEVSDKRNKLYSLIDGADMTVVRKVMRSLCKSARLARSAPSPGETIAPTEDMQSLKEPRSGSVGGDAAAPPFWTTNSTTGLTGLATKGSIQDDVTGSLKTPPGTKKTTKKAKQEASINPEDLEFEDMMAGLDDLLQSPQQRSHSPWTCGGRDFASALSFDLLSTSTLPTGMVVPHQPQAPHLMYSGATCLSRAAEDEETADLKTSGKTMFDAASGLFDEDSGDGRQVQEEQGPGTSFAPMLRIASVRQRMLAPARGTNAPGGMMPRTRMPSAKTSGAKTSGSKMPGGKMPGGTMPSTPMPLITTPHTTTKPASMSSSTLAEQHLAEAFHSDYKAKQELSEVLERWERKRAALIAALGNYERTMVASPPPLLLSPLPSTGVRKRPPTQASMSNGSSGLPKNWSMKKQKKSDGTSKKDKDDDDIHMV
jgi:hypothetical protein